MAKSFRFNANQVAFTYAQCNLSKEECLSGLRDKFKENLEEWVISQEEHKEGGLHLHGYIKLAQKINTRDPAFMDMEGFHPHLKAVKNKNGWLEYLLKEDMDPLASFDVKDQVLCSKAHEKRKRNREQLDMLMEKGPYKMLLMGEIAPCQYKTWKNAYELILKDKEEEQAQEKDPLGTELDNPWGLKLKINQDLKKCHFWIWSKAPNMGKTTWLQGLDSKYCCGWWNVNENYQNHLNMASELVLFDEFRGQITISRMNSLCDGTILVPLKGLAPSRFRQKPVVLVCGNKPPEEVYKEDHLEYIYARFEVFEVNAISRTNIILREIAPERQGSAGEDMGREAPWLEEEMVLAPQPSIFTRPDSIYN